VSTSTRIVGITLVRNEEYFITWSLASVADFCDELIVLDNLSSDRTPARLAALAERYPNIRVHRCEDANTSQSYIEEYAGRKVWVIGVDGDEIFDPAGLARLRPRILSGEFDHAWRIDGHFLNPVRVELDEGFAEGYAVPATPPGSKLYNFNAIDSWHEPGKQRLHGRNMVFRPGYSKETRHHLYEEEPWAGTDLRTLHLCFYPRTSLDVGLPARRPNPSFVKARGVRRGLIHLQNFLAMPFARDASYKARRYRRGPLVRCPIESFGRPGDYLELDPGAHESEAILRGGRIESG
jgi:glycosyltransferase involved in cell wall biosynthesis